MPSEGRVKEAVLEGPCLDSGGGEQKSNGITWITWSGMAETQERNATEDTGAQETATPSG